LCKSKPKPSSIVIKISGKKLDCQMLHVAWFEIVLVRDAFRAESGPENRLFSTVDHSRKWFQKKKKALRKFQRNKIASLSFDVIGYL
jgi:hypothetical protein